MARERFHEISTLPAIHRSLNVATSCIAVGAKSPVEKRSLAFPRGEDDTRRVGWSSELLPREEEGRDGRGKGRKARGVVFALLCSPLLSSLVRVSSGCSKGGVRVGDVDQEAEEEEKKKKEEEEKKKGRRRESYIVAWESEGRDRLGTPLFRGSLSGGEFRNLGHVAVVAEDGGNRHFSSVPSSIRSSWIPVSVVRRLRVSRTRDSSSFGNFGALDRNKFG